MTFEPTATTPGTVSPAAAQLRVLIVDEDADSRVSTRRAVQRADLDVAGESGYGTEAVSLALETRPDAILVSVEEPAARALDTADGLANALPETPILIASTASDAESVRRGMVLGARDYLVKPLDAARIREALRIALGQEERRQMRRAGQLAAVHGRGTVITVAGAKGGVGKSVVAVNLALALRQETGRTVAVIDADTQFGDVATMLDLLPEVTVAELIRRRDELDRANVRDFVTTHPSGIDVVAASEAEDTWLYCSAEDVGRMIDAYARMYDYVLVDTSGAFDPFVRACLQASTLVLVVSSGDVSSVRDTAAAAARLARWEIPQERVRFVLNSSSSERGIGADRVADAIGHDVFWVVPHDRAVVDGVQLGQPVVLRGPRSKAASSISQLARRIAGQSRESAATQDQEPLWRRLLPLKGSSDDDSALESPPAVLGRRS